MQDQHQFSGPFRDNLQRTKQREPIASNPIRLTRIGSNQAPIRLPINTYATQNVQDTIAIPIHDKCC
jgi:hypothetical protein